MGNQSSPSMERAIARCHYLRATLYTSNTTQSLTLHLKSLTQKRVHDRIDNTVRHRAPVAADVQVHNGVKVVRVAARDQAKLHRQLQHLDGRPVEYVQKHYGVHDEDGLQLGDRDDQKET